MKLYLTFILPHDISILYLNATQYVTVSVGWSVRLSVQISFFFVAFFNGLKLKNLNLFEQDLQISLDSVCWYR